MTEEYFNFKDLSTVTLQENYNYCKSRITDVFDKIDKNTNKSFENTIRPVIDILTELEPIISSFNYASNLYPDKDIRDNANELDGELKKFLIETNQRNDYYEAYLEYQNTNYLLEKPNLTNEEIRYFENSMRDFKREGLHLSDPEILEIKKKLADLAIEYNKNLNEENTSFLYIKEQLKGLPESYFTEERKASDDEYKVTLKYPDYIPVMKYVEDESVRKELYLAFNNRCDPENTKIFEETVILRDILARKLGYKTFGDYQTEIKMVKNSQTALNFLNDLNDLMTPKYNEEMKDLLDFSKNYQKLPLKKDKLDLWDYGFYSRALEEEKYQINHEEIKKYFPLDHVTKGILEIYQHLFNLKFEEVHTDNKWHPTVKLYKVNDKATDKLLGFFYLDLHPRLGKYGHAAAFDFMAGYNDKNKFRPNIVSMVCNFEKGNCITFDNIVTFFHEFGHCIHFICGKPQLSQHNSFGVEWDAVEIYSQALEYFCYCEEPLSILSRHIETGEPLPRELVGKIKDSKNFMTGYTHKRQLVFGLFDMTVHTTTFNGNIDFSDDNNINSSKLWSNIEEKVLGEKSSVTVKRAASFSHLMGGYSGGYFGYLLSNTYAAHIFYKYFEKDPMSIKEGMRYRTKMLELGSTKDAMDILTNYLDEEPNNKYYIKALGI